MNMVSDFSKHMTAFLTEYLPLQRNVSKNTITSYCDTFRLLLTYCRDCCGMSIERLSLSKFTSELIQGFLLYIETERNSSIATRNQRLAAIHSFTRYIHVEVPQYMLPCQKILQIPYKKKSKPTINYLTVEDMRLLLAQPDIHSIEGRRDLTLLSLLYDTGARVQEIADLSVRHIRLEYPAMVQLTGKGRKSRNVPILKRTVDLLKSYLSEQKLSSSDKLDRPLFFNRQGNRLTRSGIAYVLHKYVKQTSEISNITSENVSPHVLRHTKAMHLLSAGVNLIYIRDILGHADVGTTEIYAKADTEMKRAALEKAADPNPEFTPSWLQNSNLLEWLKQYGKHT